MATGPCVKSCELNPLTVGCGRPHGRNDELHSGESVLSCREDDCGIGSLARLRGADGASRLGVDRGKASEIAFGMARGYAGDAAGLRPCTGAAAGQALLGLAIWRKPQVVGIGLCPFETAFGAVDAQLQSILVTNGDLTGPQYALGAVLPSENDLDVVIEKPPGGEGRELSKQLIRLEATDEASKM